MAPLASGVPAIQDTKRWVGCGGAVSKLQRPAIVHAASAFK
jgi:hypothetical protein